MKTFLSVKAAAALYELPVSMIYRLVETGALPTVRESARARIRILPSDMDRWIATHRTPDREETHAERTPPRVTADTLPGADRYVS